jgi:hypothetical protein
MFSANISLISALHPLNFHLHQLPFPRALSILPPFPNPLTDNLPIHRASYPRSDIVGESTNVVGIGQTANLDFDLFAGSIFNPC